MYKYQHKESRIMKKQSNTFQKKKKEEKKERKNKINPQKLILIKSKQVIYLIESSQQWS